jgi:WD40 repeat protein
LFSSSLDGTLKLWDFNEGTLLKTWPIGFPILDFAFQSTCSNSVILSLKSLKKGSIQIVKLNLAQGETMEQSLDVIQSSTNVSAPLLKIPRSEMYLCMQVSFDGRYLVAATPSSCIVYNFESHERKV